MISLGDLLNEIHLDNVTGVVGRRQSGRQNLRRVSSASVEGHSLTVAMYQGHGAEELRNIAIS
jgi:hypothetical protein